MSTPAPSARSSSLKLKRADAQIREVGENAQLVLNSEITITKRDNPDSGEREWFASCDTELIEALGLMVGDSIHNMRSALDHIYCQLVIANGQEVTTQTYFPIRKSKEAYENSRVAILKEIGAGALRVLDEIAPYPGGNDDLWRLHDLDIRDKHKLLVPVASYVHGHWSNTSLRDYTKLTADAPYTDGTMKIYGQPKERVALSSQEILIRTAPLGDPSSENVEIEVRLYLDEPGTQDTELVGALQGLHASARNAGLKLAETFGGP